MKQLFAVLALFALPLISVLAKPVNYSQHSVELKKASDKTTLLLKRVETPGQQNLIGQVTSIDRTGGKITIQTDAKTSVTITFNDKTAYRRVLPGQTSLEKADRITFSDINIGDRVLIPGGVTSDQTPVRQIIVMARAAIDAQRDEEAEKRKARTINGRITAVNQENKEIAIQTRRSGEVETFTIVSTPNVKFLRYAPDSLKVSEAVAGSFTDLRVGDFVRAVGDRSADGLRFNAEELVSGAFSRMVGTISEINANRGEVVIKNGQTGQLMTVSLGKNTTFRRIPSDVAKILKSRFERDPRGGNQRGSGASNRQPQPQTNQRQNTDDGGQRANQSPRRLFENLPLITVTDLKKGDAVMIIASTSGNARMTAVSVTSGDGDLQQILLRTQGGRNDGSNMSPGLPGNVSGGNAADDDEPQN